MAANCVQDLEAAVKAVKDEYGNDPKWSGVIEAADKAVSEAHTAEGQNPAPVSPGKQTANDVHQEVSAPQGPSKLETPAEHAKETPKDESAETPDMQKSEGEDPKDMKGAAKIALLMLRKK